MIFLYCASETFASRAKVLTDSIQKHHPNDTIIHIKIEDGPLGQYLPNMAQHRLKAALNVMQERNDDVCIIGADCELFNQLYCFKLLDEFDVLLVPHAKFPLQNREYMAQIYETGHANADFMVFRNCFNSRRILKWLISVTEDGHKPGAFYEQTWLSSIPYLFEGVHIIHHPGYNVGYWDVNHVGLRTDKNGDYVVTSGFPLVLFQYSGFEKGKALEMSRHSQEKAANSTILELYQNYDKRIDK